MVLIITPEGAKALLEEFDRIAAWVKRHGRRVAFLACTGAVLWAYLIIRAIIWLFVHVRFV